MLDNLVEAVEFGDKVYIFKIYALFFPINTHTHIFRFSESSGIFEAV